MLAQRERARLHDHVVVRRRFGRKPLQLRAQLHAMLHVDLDLQRKMRDRRLRLGHPARDRLLHPRELDRSRLSPRRRHDVRRRRWRCRRRARRAGSRRFRRRRPNRGRARARAGGLHVGPHDSPARAAARQGVQVHAALARDPPRERRGLDARPLRRRRRGRSAAGAVLARGSWLRVQRGRPRRGRPPIDLLRLCRGGLRSRGWRPVAADARDQVSDGKRLALIVTLSGAASPRRRACSS